MAETVAWQQSKGRILSLLTLTILFVHAPFLYAHFVLTEDGISKNDLMVFIVLPALTYCLMVVALAVWWYSGLPGGMSLRWVAKPVRRDILGTLATIAVVYVARAILKVAVDRLHLSVNYGTFGFPHGASNLLSVFFCLVAVLVAPFAEELFWRGFVQGSLQRLFGGPTAVLVQATLFAVFHLRGFGATIMVLPFGLVAGLWRDRRKTLVPLIAAHAIVNGLSSLGSWYEEDEARGIKATRNYGVSVEELCTPPSADANDNAWFAHQKAARLLVDKPKGLADEDLKTWPTDLPSEKNRLLRDWLSANDQALTEFEAGGGMPYYCPPYSRWFLLSDSDHIGPIRHLTFAAIARAQTSAIDGDLTRSFSDVLTCCRLGRQLDGPRPLVDQMVGFAVKALTAERTARILEKVPVDSTHLASFQSEVETLYANRHAPIDFRGERLIGYDFVQRTFTDDGAGEGHVPEGVVRQFADPPPALRRLGISPEHSAGEWRKLKRKQTTELVDGVFTELDSMASRTPAELHRTVGDLKEHIQKLAESNPLVLEHTSACAGAHELAYRSRAEEDAVVVVIAVLRYRLDVGDLPGDLNTLVTKGYLKSLPTDPFSDSIFVYKKADGDFLLYSVGPDFKDDGGRPIRHGDASRDGDIVFWPVNEVQKP
jgi:membrane protease YdiL (CAAX protease family)